MSECERIYAEGVDDYSGIAYTQRRESIVRCRDCEEYHPELYSHISCELLGRYVEPDGFCAWGERKEG